jgi:hypothetical protein
VRSANHLPGDPSEDGTAIMSPKLLATTEALIRVIKVPQRVPVFRNGARGSHILEQTLFIVRVEGNKNWDIRPKGNLFMRISFTCYFLISCGIP